MIEKVRGVVTLFDFKKRYGFIEANKEVFYLHDSKVCQGSVQIGAECWFHPAAARSAGQRRQAINVRMGEVVTLPSEGGKL